MRVLSSPLSFLYQFLLPYLPESFDFPTGTAGYRSAIGVCCLVCSSRAQRGALTSNRVKRYESKNDEKKNLIFEKVLTKNSSS